MSQQNYIQQTILSPLKGRGKSHTVMKKIFQRAILHCNLCLNTSEIYLPYCYRTTMDKRSLQTRIIWRRWPEKSVVGKSWRSGWNWNSKGRASWKPKPGRNFSLKNEIERSATIQHFHRNRRYIWKQILGANDCEPA